MRKRFIRQSLRALGATCLCLSWTSDARAQQIIEISDMGGFEIFMGGQSMPSPITSTVAGQGSAEPAKDSERLKLIKKLVFDRRPSAMLSAWSAPAEPRPVVPPDPEVEKKKADEAAAAAVEPEVAPQAEQAAPKSEDVTDGPESADPTTETPAEGESTTDESADSNEVAVAEEPQLSEEELAAQAAEEKARKEAEQAEKEARQKADKEREEAQKKLKAEYEEAKKKLLEWEMKNLQRLVSLGDWAGVKAYFAEIEDFEAVGAFDQIVTSLVKGPEKVQGPLAPYAEKNFFAPEDLTRLVAAAPAKLETAKINELAQLLRLCIDEGNLLDLCLEQFRAALATEGYPLVPTQFARMLIEAGHPADAGEFLPEASQAIEENQREVLNLLTRHFLALHEKEKKVEYLENAWETTQAALADGEVDDEAKEEALKRAVAIAPDVRDELGEAWLQESFTTRPERGMEILRVIGTGTSKGLFDQAQAGPQRLENLQLQTTATEALLKAAPELASEWGSTLSLLANNWLQEALFSYQNDTSTSRGPSVTRDMYGNVFYSSYNYNYTNRNIPTALSTDELLLIRPSESWLNLISESLQPKFAMVTAQMLLKVNEEDEAFPYIEQLAQVHPKEAKELVNEFLRVWTRNNNPNSQQQRTNQFMFIYGFDAQAGGIPLTRSKQERNLTALAGWVKRLQQLPLEDIDEELISTAFTTAHSMAEVYQLETIERVFGDMNALKPETLSNLVSKMRTNLADVWRQPDLQKANKTKRRQKDIQAEILRGYEVAQSVATQALKSHPDSWSLMLVRAAVAHDENNYRHEISKSTEFAGRRAAAMADFASAARLYEAKAPELKLNEETVELYQTWFYASLGACDLNMLDHEKLPAKEQYALIRESLERLPDEASERAMASFATSIYTRMSNVNPAVKYRYVRAGLEVIGDHPRARNAREVADYYGDLVTEIKLETRVDGNAQVGSDEAFGMFVNIRHTGAIEREAGGFSKYLVNQNSNPYGFNYGRPPEDYRDKFEEATRETLSEHFEVLSVTFNHPDTNSQATEEYGWRITPYAYILMKARGPEIDRIPSLRLDLDFVDTTGYAVLPAESSPLSIVASSEAKARPFTDLKITQTLDERQAKDGKLLLEVKASASGLVPAINSFLDLAPKDFDIVNTDDQGVSVSKFDEEGADIAVVSERIWMVSMTAKEKLEALPETFEFGTDKSSEAKMEYLRFVDADIEEVGSTISLEKRYGETDSSQFWYWTLGILALLGVGAGGLAYLRRRPSKVEDRGRFRMPETISPFTVIGLLRDIESNNGVSAGARAELIGNIEHIEGYYFDERVADEQGRELPNLEAIARRWVSR